MIDPAAPAPEPKPAAVLDKMTRLASEELARTVDRRTFFKRVGGGMFLFLAGWASQGLTGRPASARALTGPGRRPAPLAQPAGGPCCAPPGPYCNLDGQNNPNGCQGGNCFKHLYEGQIINCSLEYDFYAAGCWTSSCQGGYYTCCDCECYNPQGARITSCGCAQFSLNPWRGTD